MKQKETIKKDVDWSFKKIKFGDLFEYQNKSRIKAGDGLTEGEYPFYTSSSVLSKYLDEYTFDKTSLIFGTGGNASIHYCETPFSVSTDCLVAFVKDETVCFARFVFYYLFGNINLLEEGFKGAGLKHISKGFINNLEIPLPPLPIQKRIAEILDAADALRRKDQELLKKYDELAQAIFIDMFGDPVKNEKGWEVKKLGDIINDIEAGSSYGGEDKKLDDDELGVLKVSAVTSGKFISQEYKAVKKSLILKSPVFVKQGDFLFSRANTRELVGATCIVDQDYHNLFLPDKIWKIIFSLEKCNAIFIKSILSQNSVRYELNKTATGTSGSMLNISMQKLKDLSVIIPPINLQNDYGKIYSNLQIVRNMSETTNSNTNALFQTLIQKAFNGELVK